MHGFAAVLVIASLAFSSGGRPLLGLLFATVAAVLAVIEYLARVFDRDRRDARRRNRP